MATSTTATTDPRPPRPPTSTRWVRQLLLRLHFYIGVFIGPFLLVAAVSGALYALSPQLERVVHSEALTGTVTE
ncbi:PepSY domain-containing protein, partial [Kocuria sabuli]|uniref:PepSY domain-containing protein n=1 Tax=Kocuria sabuli TaxID=3071448 RepID=UPI0034D758EE